MATWRQKVIVTTFRQTMAKYRSAWFTPILKPELRALFLELYGPVWTHERLDLQDLIASLRRKREDNDN